MKSFTAIDEIRLNISEDQAKLLHKATEVLGKEAFSIRLTEQLKKDALVYIDSLPEKERKELESRILSLPKEVISIEIINPPQIFAHHYRFYPKIKKMILAKAKCQGKYPKKRRLT